MVPGVVASHPCARPDCPTVARYVSGAGTTAAEHRGALTSPPRHTLYSAECRTTRPFLPQDEEATHRAGKGLQVGGQGHGAQDGVGRVGEADQRGQHPAKAHAVLLRAGRGWEGRPPCAASAPTTTVGSGVRSVTSTPTTTKPATVKRNVLASSWRARRMTRPRAVGRFKSLSRPDEYTHVHRGQQLRWWLHTAKAGYKSNRGSASLEGSADDFRSGAAAVPAVACAVTARCELRSGLLRT